MSEKNGPQDISWKKLVIAKSNNEWRTSAKASVQENEQNNSQKNNRNGESEEHANNSEGEAEECGLLPINFVQVEEYTPVEIKRRHRSTESRRKSTTPVAETDGDRNNRLARMSAYAANRLANETPEQRAARLKRMSEYAARRLAQETPEQREKRLLRMSAYSARRLAGETAEQRASRLARMSAYAARRQAMKKMAEGTIDEYTTGKRKNSPNPNSDSNKSVTDQSMGAQIY